MKRTLALTLLVSVCGAALATEAAPASPSPAAQHRPARASLRVSEMLPTRLEPHTAGRSAEMVLQDEDVDIEVIGPVARMVVTQTWRYDGSWFSPGDEAVCEVRTGPVSAIFDYWITEGDAVHKGIVRDRRSANAEYSKNLEQRRDPGLVEWVDEGVYRLRLYPVPKHGGLKKQSFTLLTVLPLNGDGTLKLDWTLPVHRVERLSWRIRIAGGATAVAAGAPDAVKLTPSADGTALEGELRKLPEAVKRLELVVQRPPRASRAWRTASGNSFVQVSEAVSGPEDDRPRFLACIAEAGAERALAAVTGLPLADTPAPDPEPLPDAWLPPLAAAARALRLELDESKPHDAQTELAKAAIVGPNVVLFANPFTTAEAIQAGWELAKKEAAMKQALAATPNGVPPPAQAPAVPRPTPQAPGLFSKLDFSLPAGLMAPNFKAARERANTRACFANQKTVIGAIEMYNLDRNVKAQAAVLVPMCYHAMAPALTKPAEPAVRALRSPPAGVEWAYWRDRKRMEVYRQLSGLEAAPAAAAPLVETVRYNLPAGYGQAFVESPGMAARIPDWLWQDLKNGGYLQSIPEDPGFGPATEHNYCLTSWGNGITCLSHGEIQPKLGYQAPARDQLLSEGVCNAELVNAALDYRPHPSSSYDSNRSNRTPFLGWLVAGLAVVLAFWLLAVPFVWSAPLKELRASIREGLWSALKAALWTVPAALLGPMLLLPLGYAAIRLGTCLAGMTVLLLRVLFDD